MLASEFELNWKNIFWLFLFNLKSDKVIFQKNLEKINTILHRVKQDKLKYIYIYNYQIQKSEKNYLKIKRVQNKSKKKGRKE